MHNGIDNWEHLNIIMYKPQSYKPIEYCFILYCFFFVFFTLNKDGVPHVHLYLPTERDDIRTYIGYSIIGRALEHVGFIHIQ